MERVFVYRDFAGPQRPGGTELERCAKHPPRNLFGSDENDWSRRDLALFWWPPREAGPCTNRLISRKLLAAPQTLRREVPGFPKGDAALKIAIVTDVVGGRCPQRSQDASPVEDSPRRALTRHYHLCFRPDTFLLRVNSDRRFQPPRPREAPRRNARGSVTTCSFRMIDQVMSSWLRFDIDGEREK